MKLSRSSFCEAREKLSWEAFDYLLTQVNLEEQDGFAPERWRGHRVRAIDGTTVQLPRSDELLETFAPVTGGYGASYYPYASLFIAVDLFTTQIARTAIGGRYSSERVYLKQMLSSFEEGDISILDRGLDGKSVWHAFEEHGQHFLGRLRVRGAAGLRFFSLRRKDQTVNLKLDDGTPMKVRVVRGPKFSTGNHLFLVTNLFDQKTYDRRSLLDLYRKRQAVEDVFLNFKTTLHGKNIRSRKVNGVLQEIYAALCMTSLVAGLRYLFEKRVKGKRVSFKSICWRIETRASLLLTPMKALELKHLMRAIVRFNHLKQPDRSYPRFSRQPPSKWINEKRRAKYYKKKRA